MDPTSAFWREYEEAYEKAGGTNDLMWLVGYLTEYVIGERYGDASAHKILMDLIGLFGRLTPCQIEELRAKAVQYGEGEKKWREERFKKFVGSWDKAASRDHGVPINAVLDRLEDGRDA